MKRSYLIFCLVAFLSPAAASSQSAQDDTPPIYTSEQDQIVALQDLLNMQGVEITTDLDSVIHGEKNIAISKGVWTDSQVAAFKQEYGSLPLVLPLTRVLPPMESDQIGEGDAGAQQKWVKEDSLETYFLYVKLPDSDAQKTEIRESLKLLVTDAFQQGLADSRFQKLPPGLMNAWKVKLGINSPLYPGGYQ